ncbi:MAG: ATP-binding protein [Candidatus Scalindua sp.]|nr:ATP-binding protein [Candidatus Scalindua sp.]
MTVQLTEETFERLISCPPVPVRTGADLSKDVSHAIDLRHTIFIDPYGMVGLLEVGEFLQSKGIRKTIHLPESEEVIKYLERMDFFRYAERYFQIIPEELSLPDKYSRNAFSDVLLEITPVEKSNDIHFIVGKVKERANTILKKHLHYDNRAIDGFIVALSEVCQNIIEHSENRGFVGIQKYRFQNLEKNVVKIAVMDLGTGFRNSLKARFKTKDDIDAIGKALLHGASRYTEIGRGHGLAAVRRFIKRWNGLLSIRSGKARLSIIPEWGRGKEVEHNLTHFPGAQINILLHEM